MVRLGFFVKLVERSLFAPDGDERGDGYLSAGSLASLGHAAVMYDWTSSTPLKEGYIYAFVDILDVLERCAFLVVLDVLERCAALDN